MATPLPCDNHPEVMAAVLITNLENGETLTLCGPCMFEWATVLAAVQDQGITPAEDSQTPTEDAQEPDAEELAQMREPKSEPEPEEPAEPPAQLAATPAQETQAAGE
jgi:hypothetical protein